MAELEHQELDYSQFFFKNSFTARLSKDEQSLINDNIHIFLPNDPDKRTGKEIFMNIVNLATANVTSKTSFNDLSLALQTKSEAYDHLDAEHQQLKGSLSDAELKIKELEGLLQSAQELNHELEDSVESLVSDRDQISEQYSQFVNSENVLIFHLSDFEREFINVIKQRLSAKLDKEVTERHILFDLFLKYNIERKTQIAYPFVLPPAEIRRIRSKYEKGGDNVQ